MQSTTVLLVEYNMQQAVQIVRAIEAQGLPRPNRVNSGIEAIAWVEQNPCRVCIVDYDLPDIDGLLTLTRLRQVQPNLPVIIVSGANSEAVAIAAYRAGAMDYVPKERDYQTQIANLVARVIQRRPDQGQGHGPNDANLLAKLSPPTYQNRLRVIGRQLDQKGLRSISILEVNDGFVVRAMNSDGEAERLDFLNEDFLKTLKEALGTRGLGTRLFSTSVLFPTGYEDFLRAYGYTLDEKRVEMMTLTELDGSLILSGLKRHLTGDGPLFESCYQLLGPDEINALLEEAVRRRSQPARAVTGNLRLPGGLTE